MWRAGPNDEWAASSFAQKPQKESTIVYMGFSKRLVLDGIIILFYFV